jgi:hypothetical protein
LILSYILRNLKHGFLWKEFLDMDQQEFFKVQVEMSQEKEEEEKVDKTKKGSRIRSLRQ